MGQHKYNWMNNSEAWLDRALASFESFAHRALCYIGWHCDKPRIIGKHELTLDGHIRARRHTLHSRVNRWQHGLRHVKTGGTND